MTGALGDDAFIVYGVNEEKNDLIAVNVERDDPGLEITPIQTMGLRSKGVGRISLGHKIRCHTERLNASSRQILRQQPQYGDADS